MILFVFHKSNGSKVCLYPQTSLVYSFFHGCYPDKVIPQIILSDNMLLSLSSSFQFYDRVYPESVVQLEFDF